MPQTLAITEVPGGQGDAYQCPTCGKMFPVIEGDDAPRRCNRCQSPMDVEKGAAFAKEMAERAASGAPTTQRRTVTV